jgi:hypothetical protein
MQPAEEPQDSVDGAGAATPEGLRRCVAPWYSVAARGFIPRLYLLDESGWVKRHVDGTRALPTYELALAASQLLRLDTDEPTAA